MQIYRHAQLLHPLPERRVMVLVEVVAVGVAVYHRSPEAQLAHAPLQLVGGSLWVLQGKVRQPTKTGRVQLNFFGQEIVGFAGQAHGVGGIRLRLYAGAGERQKRPFDAGRVHGRQALLAEILQAGQNILHGLGG